MTDHVWLTLRSMRSEPGRDRTQVLSGEQFRRLAETRNHVVHPRGGTGRHKTIAHRRWVEPVQASHGVRQHLGQLTGKPRQSRDGTDTAQPRQHRAACGEVHDHEGMPEPVVWSSGELNGWGRKPLDGNLFLDSSLLRCDPRIRHHPCDELSTPVFRGAPQAEAHQMCPEPAGQSCRRHFVLDVGPDGSAEHSEQVSFERIRLVEWYRHSVYCNGRCCYCRCMTEVGMTSSPELELTVDELASRSGVPVRTIREYQAEGLVPPPERRGRVGIYRASHVTRLELIGRLQSRGYSLAAIRDLVRSWSDGADLGDVLGLNVDELVHLDEPGRPATVAQLALVLPNLVPARLDDLIAAGLIEPYGDTLCVPSPSLLQLTVDAAAAGYEADAILALLRTIREATATIADATLAMLGERPAHHNPQQLISLANRGRGLLAHATGRLTVHTIGRRLGVERDDDLAPALVQFLEIKS